MWRVGWGVHIITYVLLQISPEVKMCGCGGMGFCGKVNSRGRQMDRLDDILIEVI